jgi:hypothetical protein
MKKKLYVLGGMLLASAPVVALAQTDLGSQSSSTCNLGPNDGTLFGLICRIGNLLNAVVPVLIALGVLYFVWGVISYVIASDEEAKKAGRDRIIFGIIGLAVIIGLWGLVNLLRRTFGLNNNQTYTLPTVPITGGNQ